MKSMLALSPRKILAPMFGWTLRAFGRTRAAACAFLAARCIESGARFLFATPNRS
jgi:hypothetical protein